MRDPEASDSFTLAQLDTIFADCRGRPFKLQTREGWYDDPTFLEHTTQALAYTGMHISVLSGGWRRDDKSTVYSAPIDSSAIRGDFLFWRRPKNEKPIPMPIKKEIAPWLGAFFDQAKPRSTRRYEQILEEVEARVGFPCNPLRFRHTCGVLLYHVLKLDAATVQRLMGFTAATMLTYVVRTKEQIREEMVGKGW